MFFLPVLDVLYAENLRTQIRWNEGEKGHMRHGRSVGSRFVGDKRDLPPLIGNPYNGYINP